MSTKENKKNIKPLMAVIAVNFIWGFDFIAIEYMMEYVPASIFTLTRLIIGSAVLVALVFIKNGGLRIKKEDLLRVFISGGIGFSFYFTLENVGTGITSASFSSLIMAMVPIFGMIGDRLFFKNKITLLKSICVFGSIVGVYMLVTGEPMGINIPGLLFMLGAALLWSIYIVYVKPLYEKYDLITLLAGLFLSGLIVQIPLTLISQPAIEDINFTPTGILITVLTSLICIIAGEFGYIYAIGKLSVTTVSIFENVLPLVSVVFSFIIFGTMLSWLQIIGGIVILAAVTVVALKE